MTLKRIILSLVMGSGLAAGHIDPAAEATANEIDALRRQIEELDQKLRVLERQRELEAEVAAEKAKDLPRITAGAGGLSVNSADSNFVFRLRGLVQVDSRTFFDDSPQQRGNDSFLLRRARPIFQGTIARDFDFMFVPEFGGSSASIVDAWLNYRYAPWLQLRAGKFKVPVGLEQLQSDPVTFFNERALPTALVPNRDIGFQLWGEVAGGRLSYAAGVFNGVGDGRNTSNADFEDNGEFAGRLFAQPFLKSDRNSLRGLGFGVGSSFGNVDSSAAGLANAYLTDGQQSFFTYTNGTVADGTHWRLSPQAHYYYGPFGLLAEYTISHQRVRNGPMAADLGHTGWQVAAGWVLTGEDVTFAGVTPRKPFSLADRQWGAFQLVARYAELDIDNDTFGAFADPAVSASDAQAWSVGLNWYLNRNLRLNTSFSRTTFGGGGGAGSTAPAIVTRQPEQVLFTRLQLVF